MKTAYLNSHDTLSGLAAPVAGENLLEGVPTDLPKIKASVSNTPRPHILARRAARWSRRAAH